MNHSWHMQMYFAVICAALWRHRGESLHLRGEQTNECKKTKPLSGGRLSLSLLLNSSSLLSIAPPFQPSLLLLSPSSFALLCPRLKPRRRPSVRFINQRALVIFFFFSLDVGGRTSEFLPLPAGGLGRSKPLTIEVSNGCIKKKKQKTLDSQSAVAELHFPSGKKKKKSLQDLLMEHPALKG